MSLYANPYNKFPDGSMINFQFLPGITCGITSCVLSYFAGLWAWFGRLLWRQKDHEAAEVVYNHKVQTTGAFET